MEPLSFSWRGPHMKLIRLQSAENLEMQYLLIFPRLSPTYCVNHSIYMCRYVRAKGDEYKKTMTLYDFLESRSYDSSSLPQFNLKVFLHFYIFGKLLDTFSYLPHCNRQMLFQYVHINLLSLFSTCLLTLKCKTIALVAVVEVQLMAACSVWLT